MGLSEKQQDELRILTLKSLAGELDPDAMAHLREWLRNDTEARASYLDFMMIHHSLYQSMGEVVSRLGDENEGGDIYEALSELLKNEKTAPAVKVAETSTAESIHPTAEFSLKTSSRTPLRKSSWISILISSAALIYLVLLAHLQPVSHRQEVATLHDSIAARWADYLRPLEKGCRLTNNHDPLLLREGIAELWFDNNARITIEGPAEFQIMSLDQIQLNYGRIYAHIPAEAIGFSVNTPAGKAIDLGTEFGVHAGLGQEMELHVIKGRTTLIAGTDGMDKSKIDMVAGQARHVNRQGQANEIPVNETVFVRVINSDTGLIWRGQKVIDLADVVGNGCGFGTGRLNTGIDPSTGRSEDLIFQSRRTNNQYHAVTDNAFVDGVFVPNGFKSQVISTLGNIFKECPVTQGYFFADICNTPKQISRAGNGRTYPLVFDGIDYQTGGRTCIFMHANTGITFDLDAFRVIYPGARILRFSTQAGLSENTPNPTGVAFWILVDGEIRYQQETGETVGSLGPVTVDLSQSDRFLTLVTTEGSVSESQADRFNVGYDWGIFDRPVLILE